MDQLELQKRILRHLSQLNDDQYPLESMDLAAAWDLDGGEVVHACDGLISQGLVKKESYRSSPSNVVMCQLTEEGKRYVTNELRRRK